jgi:hypothetical protein
MCKFRTTRTSLTLTFPAKSQIFRLKMGSFYSQNEVLKKRRYKKQLTENSWSGAHFFINRNRGKYRQRLLFFPMIVY